MCLTVIAKESLSRSCTTASRGEITPFKGYDMTTKNHLLDQEFTIDVCFELLPEWKGLDVRIMQLSGGITNKLYRIQSEKGDYTVRIYGDKTDLFINRDQEIEAQKAMAAIGVGAPLVKYLPERGVTIVE